jgi:DNA-binding transcriptional MerR regulator
MVMIGGDNMDDWLLIGEIAQQTKMAENTLRRYCRLFSDFLVCEQYGRITRYSPDCIPIFERISYLFSKGSTQEEIQKVLEKETSMTVQPPAEQEEVPAVITPALFIYFMTQMSNSLTALADQDARINSLESKIEGLEKQIEARDAKVMEQIRQKQEERKRPWWKRLMN